VTLMPVKAPHWVRGAETAELVDYAGRPDGVTQQLRITALGGSPATKDGGLTAPVLVVNTFDDLSQRATEAKGKTVLFDFPFDQELADNGHSARAYELAAAYRRQGPAAAARVGAIAALVRSVGGANYRLPHTGLTNYEDVRIPAAAISAEDSALIARLAAEGVVTLKLVLTPRSLPDVDSHNVIADLTGREKPEEIVIVSGHLDSWDLGTGAIDDGAGVAAAMGVAHVLRELGLRPRRTIRVVAWMSEEIGGAGAAAYFAANQANIARHAAVIESDNGAGRPLGFAARITAGSVAKLQPVRDALFPIGATVIDRVDAPRGADITDLQYAGIPGFEPLLDSRRNFDYHHTAADNLDKVDPANLRRIVASMAVLSYYLAEHDEVLERTEVGRR
jgi:carboxypeptidase Q